MEGLANLVLTKEKRKEYAFIVLLSGLLLLRFPFLILLCFDKIPISYKLGVGIMTDGTYILTATIIFLKRDTLSDYHFGFFSILVFLFAPVARFFSELILSEKAQSGAIPMVSWIQIVVSICLLVALMIKRTKLRKRSVKEILLWLLISIITGLLFGVVSGAIISLQGSRGSVAPSFYHLIRGFVLQLGNAAVIEEPLFRGFLWGFLRSLKWKEFWIWVFQALLFMVGHLYYFGVANYSFWIVVPLCALVLGLLVWRSRSIGTSMIAHGLINSVGDIVAHFAW